MAPSGGSYVRYADGFTEHLQRREANAHVALLDSVVHKHNCKSVRLPNNISIFRAELYALVLAIEVVRRLKEQNFIIFSDSKSSLEAINNFQIEVELVQKFIKEYTLLSNSGKNILLCWIPSRTGIWGNEKADTAAKAALLFLRASAMLKHVITACTVVQAVI